jgi:hypothetical protein
VGLHDLGQFCDTFLAKHWIKICGGCLLSDTACFIPLQQHHQTQTQTQTNSCDLPMDQSTPQPLILKSANKAKTDSLLHGWTISHRQYLIILDMFDSFFQFNVLRVALPPPV